MIKAIFIVLNGAYAFSRQYLQQVDPTMLSGLLTALRASSKEISEGEFRQAKFGDSDVFVDGLSDREGDFVAIFATADERQTDLTNLMALIKTAFISRFGEKLHSWTSLDGPFNEFESTIDQIIAGCIWCDTEEPTEAPNIMFNYDLAPDKETIFRGKDIAVKYNILNVDNSSVKLMAISNAVPELFSVDGVPDNFMLRNTIFLRNKRLRQDEEFHAQIKLKARRIGHTELAPILFVIQGSQAFSILGENKEFDII